MINNDVLRAIRYMLDLSDGKVVEITHLADANFPISREDVQSFLKKDEEPGYAECSNAVLAHFLDGLVFHRRGRDESLPPRPVEKRVTNNVVLKKLRVAFELKDVDMHQILQARTQCVVPPARAQEFSPVRRPVAAEFPEGADDARASRRLTDFCRTPFTWREACTGKRVD
jgi:uncharacterized protein YehS (DUF1456 family)